jgi:hypothetical protein
MRIRIIHPAARAPPHRACWLLPLSAIPERTPTYSSQVQSL